MKNSIDEERNNQIITFLISLNIKSKRFEEILKKKNHAILKEFNTALTHSSKNKINNYEKLEFFGDAVLRLAASMFLERKHVNMNVGKRSELRSLIVSDEWLTQLGKKIDIEKVIIKGCKATRDNESKNTIIAEATEALIGAIYKTFNSIEEVNIWLDDFWEEDSKIFLKEPYKYNAKSALQEWCQSKGYELPIYKINELSKIHGDPKRFSCDIFVNGSKEVRSFGKSHKKAEKNAAGILIEKLLKEGKR
tara:strand:- start:211 stop:960 length:750 start_codon:yes stop_codon:yes gene_type:complete